MGWLSTLKESLQHKKRTQEELVAASCESTSMDEDDDPGMLVPPASTESDDEFTSRPKRRSVSVDINTPWTSRASTDSRRQSMDRRTSLELWQEARRQRNSTDYTPGGTISTDKLTVCKAGHTMVVNKTYITIKHLGSGTFGRVMLCFNMYDQRLYAIKACRKSQFVAQLSRYSHGSRLRRGSHFSPSPTSTCGMRSNGLPQGAFNSNGSSGGSGAPSPRTTGSYAGSGAFGSAFPGSSFSGGAAFGGVFGSAAAGSGHVPNGISNGHVSTGINSHVSNGVSNGFNSHVSHGGMPNGSAFQDAVARFQTDELVKEIAILKKLSHPNIVNLVEVIDDPTTDSLLLVMEYVEGGTLEPAEVAKGSWERVPEQEVWMYVREVLQGMDYLHYNKVVHGDLKPANLLLDSNGKKVKIADFGSSIMAGSDKCFSRNYPGFSTPAFRSPESLISGYQPSYEMDMWALGVCIYMWVFGHLPFTGAAPFIIYEKIRSQDIQLPDGENGGMQPVSSELRDFMMQLLEKDVLKRLDVVAAMHHPWVTLSGAAPLASLREQQFAASVAMEGMTGNSAAGPGGIPRAPLSRVPSGVGVVSISQEDMDAAIRQIDGSTAQVMDQVFMEVQYCDGQEIVSAGDSASKIFLIACGEVEILADATGNTPGNSFDGATEVSSSGLISGFEMDTGDAHDGDMFDVRVSDMASSPEARELLLQAIDRRRAGSHPLQQARTRRIGEPLKKLIAIKGAGESLGPPFVKQRTSISGAPRTGLNSVATDHRWRVCVRARGPVTAFRARLEDLVKLVEQHPEMEGAMKQMGTAQETDMMVAEAMRQLRLLNDCTRSHLVDTAMTVSA